jgi:hypothetical protein
MQEQKWHELTRLAIIAKLGREGKEVKGSHQKNPKIELYRHNRNQESRLSDADIAVFNRKEKIVPEIVEVESEINPKKFVGIVLITHLCTLCFCALYLDKNNPKSKSDEFDLRKRSVSLKIVYKAPEEGSLKAEKLGVMKEALKPVIDSIDGCLKDFDWIEEKQYLDE